MKYLSVLRAWWKSKEYQWYRPEYKRLQNRLFSLGLAILALCSLGLLLLAWNMKFPDCNYDIVAIISRFFAVVFLVGYSATLASVGVIGYVDRHEKKLHSKRRKTS